MTHLVIGRGQIGSAIAEVISADIRDVEPHDGNYDTLHICFPWTPAFADYVQGYVYDHGAYHVVVHSTVPVGTCDPRGWTHSPIRGRHPHLSEGVRTFTKHFGGPHARKAAEAFMTAGIKCKHHATAATTEAGKLWELAQFGVEVAMNKRIHNYCERNNLPFDEVYTVFGEAYNDGYRLLGEQRFIKPVLKYVPGGIGGHCITQNSPMLGEQWVNDILAPHTGEGPAGGSA